MTKPINNAEAIIAVLLPELEKLARNSPQYGELTMRVKISDYQVGTISLGIETSRKITAKGGEPIEAKK
jgi:hypothetical protein